MSYVLSDLQRNPDPEKILGITRSKGYFEVSWKWRNERLVKCCLRLVRDGKLVRIKRGSGAWQFKLPEQPMPPGFEKWHERKRRHGVQNDRPKGSTLPVLRDGEEPASQ